MMKAKKVKDHPSLIKDTETNAVISTDEAQLRAYKKKKNQLQEMNNVQTRLETFESELTEVKEMLSTIVRKLDHDK